MGLLGQGSGFLGLNNPGSASYKWVDNGNGGVNYYVTRGGLTTPVTREVFAKGAGQDVGAIEQSVLNNYNANKSSGPANIASGGNYGGSGSTYNPAYSQTLAQLNQAEQRAGNQYNIAKQNVNNGYQSALDQLLAGKVQQDKVFATTRDAQNSDYQSGRQDINQSVGNAYTGLQRLLGNRGAGNSSAASILAPYAAGQQGNVQTNDLQNAYSKNVANLENSINSYNTNFDNSKRDLETQRQTNLNSAQSAYDNARAQILSQRAALNPGNASAYQSQINDLLNSVDRLALKPTFTPKTPEYVAPDLQALQAGQIAPATIGGVAPGAVQNTGAFANLLNPDKRKLVGSSPIV